MSGVGSKSHGKLKPVQHKPNSQATEASPPLSQPGSGALQPGNTPSMLRVASGVSAKSTKTTSLIVKKKTTSSCIAPASSMPPTAPLFPSESRSKRSQRSESGEELLNLLKGSNVILPLPTPGPARESSAHRSPPSSDKQRIIELENKLRRLGAKYKKLEGSYRSLLVKSVGRESTSPDLEYTRDSVQFSFTPRRYADEPIVEVLHTLTDLKTKVDRIESLTSTMWSALSQKKLV